MRWVRVLAGAVAVGVLGACSIVAGLNDYSNGVDGSVSSGASSGSGASDGGPGESGSTQDGGATCASTLDDVLNCGACGNACDTTRSVGAACVNGVCTYSGCASDWLDCNQTAPNVDGCESSRTALGSCGGCGEVCDTELSLGASCVETDGGTVTCEYTGCQPGYGDCDQAAPNANGCETPLNTAANCGVCGRKCDTTNSQAASCADGTTCSYGGCNAGYADCDTTPPDTNGCETSLVGAASCAACGQSCDTTHSNFDTCDTSSGAVCKYTSCKAGYADCNKTPPDTNGCETSITTISNCGACGRSCDTTNSTGTSCSSSGNCQYSGCKAGWANCDPTNHDTNGCESSLTSTTSCGACGAACNTNTGAASCDGNTCSYQCNSGLRDCNANNSPDTDGCECASPGCCGNGCQTIHSNGLGQNFYDCNDLGTQNESQAQAACAAATGDASACRSSSVCCGAFVFFCLGTIDSSVCGSVNGKCYCWQYSGTSAGRVQAVGSGFCSASCGSGSDPSWN